MLKVHRKTASHNNSVAGHPAGSDKGSNWVSRFARWPPQWRAKAPATTPGAGVLPCFLKKLQSELPRSMLAGLTDLKSGFFPSARL